MFKRLYVYLSEMFPLTSFAGTMLTGLAFQLIYIRLYGLPAQFHYQMLLSGLVITSVSLLIRVMDEFKDYPDDLRNFPHRPLPSGRVLPSDLKMLGWFCLFMVLALSVTHLKLFLFALCMLGYTFLMLKWFFIEKNMRQSLPLAFISHHPIVLFNIVYVIYSMLLTYEGLDWSKLIYVLPVALIFTNWEVSRKIRAPEQETAYTTYSMIFGPRVAILITLTLQSIYICSVYYIFGILNSPLYLKVIFGVLMSVLVFPYLKFLFTLKLDKLLKPNAENQILLVISTLIAAAIL